MYGAPYIHTILTLMIQQGWYVLVASSPYLLTVGSKLPLRANTYEKLWAELSSQQKISFPKNNDDYEDRERSDDFES